MTTPTPNMNLPEPVVSTTGGPDWATQLNNCLDIIDSHDHSSGYGVPVTPAGMNISTDLSMNINNLTLVRSVRFSPQVAPLGLVTDLGCLYESGVDLYYNDGSGNQVRITQSGGVAGSPGSIASLSSPASATYVSASAKFVWQSAANVAASLDARNLILRSSAASSFGLTLTPPTIAADFTLTLPTVPVGTRFMTLDNTGVMGASYNVDNSTLEVSSNLIQVKDGGVTKPKLAALGQQVSTLTSLTFSTSSTSFVDVTNLTVSITTTGRPVFVAMIPDPAGADAAFCSAQENSSGGDATGIVAFLRGATNIGQFQLSSVVGSGANFIATPGTFLTIDVVAAGTYTYKVQAKRVFGDTFGVNYFKLIAYEL
jgi:hypothetical protein